MNNLKALFHKLYTDFPKASKSILIYILIDCTTNFILFSIFNIPMTDNNLILVKIMISVLILLICMLVFPINNYYFQKSYSNKIGLKFEFLDLLSYLKELVKIIAKQFLIFVAIALVLSIIMYSIFLIVKVNFTVKVYIFIIILMISGIIWFYRLLFIGNLIVYKRTNQSTGIIFIKNKYMLVNNKYFIIAFYIIPYCISLIISLLNNHNFSYPSKNIYLFSINLCISVFASICCVCLTSNEIKESNRFSSEFIIKKS